MMTAISKPELRWNKEKNQSSFFKKYKITSSQTILRRHQQVAYWSAQWKKIMMTTLKCEEIIEFSLPGVSFGAVL